MVLWIFIGLLIAFVLLPFLGAAIWWTLAALFSGIVLGGLARLVVPGRQNIGLLATIICGWVGSIGGWALAGVFWGFSHNHHHFQSILIEIGIAAIAVYLWSLATRNRPRNQAVIVTSNGTFHRIVDL